MVGREREIKELNKIYDKKGRTCSNLWQAQSGKD